MNRLKYTAALILAAAPVGAFHTARMSLDSVDAAQLVMSANPPLPMSRMSAGAWKLSVQPAYFTGKPIHAEGSNSGTVTTGDYTGFGAGLGFSYAWTDRWGAYLIGIGAASSGDFQFGKFDNCNNDCFSFAVTDAKASFNIAMFGLMYQALPGGEDGGRSLQLFSGPVITRVKSEQRFIASSGGTVDEDFDMELDNIQFGINFGAQAGLNLGKSFRITPYLLAAAPLGESCAEYDVPAIRVVDLTDPLSQQSDLDCGGTTDGSAANPPRSVVAGLQYLEVTGGINLIYKPWGLTVSLTAPFLKKLESDISDIALITFSLPFGSYDK